ncbi:MAG: hypothetical protein IKK04_09975 [Bacteroidales bacterium]|nr:hypothetical protein [Bacteroidales bacterium]
MRLCLRPSGARRRGLRGPARRLALSTLQARQGEIQQSLTKRDIMLYGDNCVVVFYETFTTTYQYTPIGHITNTEGLKEALGSGKLTINFTIKNKENET